MNKIKLIFKCFRNYKNWPLNLKKQFKIILFALIWSSILLFLSKWLCEIYIDYLPKITLWTFGLYTGLGIMLICKRADNKFDKLEEQKQEQ